MDATRRTLFGAAAAALTAPAAMAAPRGSELSATLTARNTLANAINIGDYEALSEADQNLLLDRLWALDDAVHDAPIRSTADVRTKLAHLLQLDKEGYHVAAKPTLRLMGEIVSYLEAN